MPADSRGQEFHPESQPRKGRPKSHNGFQKESSCKGELIVSIIKCFSRVNHMGPQRRKNTKGP